MSSNESSPDIPDLGAKVNYLVALKSKVDPVFNGSNGIGIRNYSLGIVAGSSPADDPYEFVVEAYSSDSALCWLTVHHAVKRADPSYSGIVRFIHSAGPVASNIITLESLEKMAFHTK